MAWSSQLQRTARAVGAKAPWDQPRQLVITPSCSRRVPGAAREQLRQDGSAVIAHAADIASPQLERRAVLLGAAGLSVWPTAVAQVAHGQGLSVSDIYASYSYASPQDVLPFIQDQAPPGDPERVLQAIDDFSVAFPMYKIGPEKGAILDAVVQAVQPQLAIEIGSFIGYSAVRIARYLPPGGRLVCVEANSDCVSAMEGVLRHAGLRDRVIIEQGLSTEVVPRLMERYGPAQLLFEDHCKPCYLPDLLTAETSGLLPAGAWTMADNVLVPNPLPELLAHLGDAERYRAVLVKATYEYDQAWNPDWVSQKEDAMSVAVRTSGLTGDDLRAAEEKLTQLCKLLGSKCTWL